MKCKRCDVLLLGVVEKDTGICVVCQRHPQFMVPRAGDNAVPRAAAVTTTPLPLRTPAARPTPPPRDDYWRFTPTEWATDHVRLTNRQAVALLALLSEAYQRRCWDDLIAVEVRADSVSFVLA